MQNLGAFQTNQVYTGDGRELIKSLPDECIDLILSDPPFKISQTYTQNVDADNMLAISAIWILAKEWYRVCKPGCYAAIYYDTRILPLIIYAMANGGWKYMRGLTFYRRWGNANKLYGWMSTSDFILLFRKPADEPMQFYSDDWRHDVYTKDKPEIEGMNHPAQKPLADVRHLVKHLCPPDGVLLDTYIGSGTSALAAMFESRNFLGFEIDPITANTARKRVADFELPMFANNQSAQQPLALDWRESADLEKLSTLEVFTAPEAGTTPAASQ